MYRQLKPAFGKHSPLAALDIVLPVVKKSGGYHLVQSGNGLIGFQRYTQTPQNTPQSKLILTWLAQTKQFSFRFFLSPRGIKGIQCDILNTSNKDELDHLQGMVLQKLRDLEADWTQIEASKNFLGKFGELEYIPYDNVLLSEEFKLVNGRHRSETCRVGNRLVITGLGEISCKRRDNKEYLIELFGFKGQPITIRTGEQVALSPRTFEHFKPSLHYEVPGLSQESAGDLLNKGGQLYFIPSCRTNIPSAFLPST